MVGNQLSNADNRSVGLHSHGVADPGYSHLLQVQSEVADEPNSNGHYLATKPTGMSAFYSLQTPNSFAG